MTFGECRDLSLNLIHQETIAGTVIPGTYDNQQDYLNKIPGLVNAAQMEIATTTKPIPEEVTLGDLKLDGRYEEKNGNYIYDLSALNMWQRRGSGLIVPIPYRGYFQGLRHGRYNRMRMVGNTRLILPECLPDDTILEYYRYPWQLSTPADDADVLDNTLEAQMAVPYYVAAHVVMYDDAFLYATLQNEYTAKREALRELPHTEIDTVEDVYMDPSFDYHNWW